MLQALFPALFGLLALAIACVSVRSGRATFRGMHFARRDRPAAFRRVVAFYLVLGLVGLAGALWICLLSARGRSVTRRRSRAARPPLVPSGRVGSRVRRAGASAIEMRRSRENGMSAEPPNAPERLDRIHAKTSVGRRTRRINRWRIIPRARHKRPFTVPIGQPRIRATSVQVFPST